MSNTQPIQNQHILEAARDLFERTGFEADVKWVQHDRQRVGTVAVTLKDHSGMLIGKQGANLDSLEHLVRVLVARRMAEEDGGSEKHSVPYFILDINDYRLTQTQRVMREARETAQKVIENRRAESLSPMSSYERRLVHTELSDLEGIVTQSVGQEPQRRIIIKPASELS